MEVETVSGGATEVMEDNFSDAEERIEGLQVVGFDNTQNKGGEQESWSDISPAEADLICRFHRLLGDRWELIAARFPNRKAEEVERYWKMTERSKVGVQKLIKPKCVKLSSSFRFSMESANLT